MVGMGTMGVRRRDQWRDDSCYRIGIGRMSRGIRSVSIEWQPGSKSGRDSSMAGWFWKGCWSLVLHSSPCIESACWGLGLVKLIRTF